MKYFSGARVDKIVNVWMVDCLVFAIQLSKFTSIIHFFIKLFDKEMDNAGNR